MNTATSLLVRHAPEPRFGLSTSPPEQVPLPLAGIPQLRLTPMPAPDPTRNPLKERASHFMQVLIEVLAGERPVRQLGAWMSAEVFEQLQRQLLSQARGPQRLRVHAGSRIASVHVSMVNETTSEVSARMVHGGRSRAVAIRLELQTNVRGLSQWRCTALVWA